MVEICLEESVPMSVTTSEREQEPAADRFALSLWLRWPRPEQILLWHETRFRLPEDEEMVVIPVPAHPSLFPLGTASLSSQRCSGGMGG